VPFFSQVYLQNQPQRPILEVRSRSLLGRDDANLLNRPKVFRLPHALTCAQPVMAGTPPCGRINVAIDQVFRYTLRCEATECGPRPTKIHRALEHVPNLRLISPTRVGRPKRIAPERSDGESPSRWLEPTTGTSRHRHAAGNCYYQYFLRPLQAVGGLVFALNSMVRR